MEEIDYLNEMWGSASVFVDQQQQQWAANETLVNGRHLTPRKAGRSSIFVPKIPAYVKRKIADIVAQAIGDNPVTIKHTLTSSPVGAKIKQEVHNFYLHRDINYDALVYNMAYCGFVYNYAPVFLDWVETTHLDEETGEELVIESYPVVTALPPEDVRVDAAVSWNEIDEARYVAFRTYKSRSFAEEMREKGKWPEIPDEAAMVTTNNSNVLSYERRQVNSPFQQNSLMDIDNDLIEIRYHFYFREDEDGYTPVRAVTAGDTIILEEPTELEVNWGGNKHGWPFAVGQVYPKPFEQFAAALPELAKDLQIEVNAIRNQRRDNVALILNPEKYVTPHAGVTPAQLSFSYPGKVVSVDNLSAIQWQTVPDVTQTGHNEESRAEQDMDRLFSEGPMRQGVEGKRKESATAIQMMASNASASTGLDTVMFMASALKDIHFKLGNAIAQKAPEEVFKMAADSLGIDTSRIDPYLAAVSGDFIYNAFASATQNDIAKALANTSNIMGIVQTAYGPNANYRPMLADLLEVAGYDPDVIIPSQQALQQGMPNTPEQDMGGVQPDPQPIQPRSAFQGGAAMAEGGGGTASIPQA